jgi:penicillin-binding protein 2
VITGIGQGYHQVTPLQLAKATATLANRGKVITPHLVEKIVSDNVDQRSSNKPETLLDLKPANVDTVIDAMVNVVHSGAGTAHRISGLFNFKVAGKTGTAQVFNIKQNASYKESQVDFKLRDHALFIAFAPAVKPKIAIAVIAENGGHGGSVAAPIAAKIIDQYLNPKPSPQP